MAIAASELPACSDHTVPADADAQNYAVLAVVDAGQTDAHIYAIMHPFDAGHRDAEIYAIMPPPDSGA